MSDLISRQAAIEALEKCHKQCCREDATGDEWIHYETTLNEVESIPPAPKNDADCIRRQAAIAHAVPLNLFGREVMMVSVSELENLPSAEPEIKPIDYQDCANAMLRMWMDEVITDGEYNRVMDKLNAFWRTEE